MDPRMIIAAPIYIIGRVVQDGHGPKFLLWLAGIVGIVWMTVAHWGGFAVLGGLGATFVWSTFVWKWLELRVGR